MEPALGAASPEIQRKRVVLPAPLGPTMQTNSPFSTRNDTRSMAMLA
jgi:hypothetical protein